MSSGASRGARTIVAMGAVAGVALAAVGACTLYSSGLADLASDASVIVPSGDAGFDAPFVAPTDANEAAADVIGISDGPDACAPIETDCLDGIDNDCNGQTDCADPACGAGYECVPSPASGWSGYALYDDGRATPCPAAYPTQVDTYEGLLFSPASCTACMCTPSGTSCGMTSIACDSTISCGPTLDTFGSTCDDFGAPIALDQTSGCLGTAPQASGGSCAGSGGSLTASPVSFSKFSRTCGAAEGPGGGCATGNACVAKPPTGTHGVCVSQLVAGSTLCPSAYPHAYVVMPSATSFDDTRACSACSCGGLNAAECSGTVTLYPLAECTDGTGGSGGFGGDDAGSASFPADGFCHALLLGGSGSFASGVMQTNVSAPGSCAPDGGVASGTVTPKDQTAYCCLN